MKNFEKFLKNFEKFRKIFEKFRKIFATVKNSKKMSWKTKNKKKTISSIFLQYFGLRKVFESVKKKFEDKKVYKQKSRTKKMMQRVSKRNFSSELRSGMKEFCQL